MYTALLGVLPQTDGSSASVVPYMVRLSFDWNGEALMVTPADSSTSRDLAATWAVRRAPASTPRALATPYRWWRIPTRIQVGAR